MNLYIAFVGFAEMNVSCNTSRIVYVSHLPVKDCGRTLFSVFLWWYCFFWGLGHQFTFMQYFSEMMSIVMNLLSLKSRRSLSFISSLPCFKNPIFIFFNISFILVWGLLRFALVFLFACLRLHKFLEIKPKRTGWMEWRTSTKIYFYLAFYYCDHNYRNDK